MVSINYAFREISCKIVYYGPGLSGKTTNLQYVHQKVPGKTKGELISLATDADRTLYFDFLPINLGAIQGFATKFQLYTVPGQVYYNATRKLVLRGVDGLVFVADSQRAKMDENLESLKNLYDNLQEYGYDSDDLPLVIQYNKRDLPDVMSVEEMQAALNPHGLSYFEASAVNGTGVFDTLKMIIKLVLDKARRGSEIQTPSAEAAKTPAAEAAKTPAVAPTPDVTTVAPTPDVTTAAPTPDVTTVASPAPASPPEREPVPAVAQGAPAVEPSTSPVVAPAPAETIASAPPTPVTAMASAATIQQSVMPAADEVVGVPAPAVPIRTTDPASHDPQAIALPSSAETESQAVGAVQPDEPQVATSSVSTDTTPSVIPAAPSLKKQPERKKKRGFWRKLFSWK